MSDNDKGTRRPKLDKDPIHEKRRTIGVRTSHHDFIEVTPKVKGNFSGFVGSLIDDFFVRDEIDKHLVLVADSKRLTGRDFVTLIGNDINIHDAARCLIAWLDGGPICEVKISHRAVGLYKSLEQGLKDTPAAGFILEDSRRLLEDLRVLYFDQKAIHLTNYLLLNRLLKSSFIVGKERKYTIERSNELIGMEYTHIGVYCSLSPQVRFAVYDCWKNHILRVRALRPGWTAEAADHLKAMNHRIDDPTTAGIVDDEADFDDAPADY